MDWNTVNAVVIGLATLALVVVTFWYARLTAKILEHTERQSKVMAEQSEMLELAAIISATAALHSGTGQDHTYLASLRNELEQRRIARQARK
jgi:hypothetical protein